MAVYLKTLLIMEGTVEIDKGQKMLCKVLETGLVHIHNCSDARLVITEKQWRDMSGN